jgi:hypothetical protein
VQSDKALRKHEFKADTKKRRSRCPETPFSLTSKRLGRFADEFDGVAKGLDGLSGVIGNLDAELFFEGHNQLYGVQAVCAQIVDEGSIFSHFVFFNTQVLNNDLFNAICDVAHVYSSFYFRAVSPVLPLPARGGVGLPIPGG